MKRVIRVGCVLGLAILILQGCGKKETQILEEMESKDASPTVEIQVFIAASLSDTLEELKERYLLQHPNLKITYNADSSGTLLTQIEEGYACDIFFSADTEQVIKLEEDKMIIPGTRVDYLKNQVVLIAPKGVDTLVTGFETINLASSIALADGSVPVGKYTRNILMKTGFLPETKDPASITAKQIKEALNNIEINECSNVSKVKEAIKEASNEVGCVYYSDAYSIKEEVDIIAFADTDLTGEIIYPVVQVVNQEAGEAQLAAAEEFRCYLISEEAKGVFEKHMFLINE